MKMKLRGIRALCILLAMLLAFQTGLSLTGSNSYKAYAETDGDFTFEVVDGSAVITGYTGEGGEVTIPLSVMSGDTIYNVNGIGDSAFSGINSITSITIPNGVSSVGWQAFSYCSSLNNISIPSSLTNIGMGAFVSCSSLQNIFVASDNTQYKSIDGILYNYDKSVLVQYPGGKSGNFEIPSSVTSIGTEAFYGCEGLTTISIPITVTDIGVMAFGFCTNLAEVEIPNSVSNLGEGTFYYCNSLTSIIVPSSVSFIDDWAFEGCSKLSAAFFLGNAPTCSGGVFEYCADTFTVYYLEANTGFTNPWYGYPTAIFNSESLCTATFDSQGGSSVGAITTFSNTYISAPNDPTMSGYFFAGWYKEQECINAWNFRTDKLITNTTLFAKWTTSDPSIHIDGDFEFKIFDGSAFISGYKGEGGDVTIPSMVSKEAESYTVTGIGASAFDSCNNLTSITIPISVTSIENYAFANCFNLTSIFIPNSVTSIGDWAFYSCRSLASIEIPNSVTSIGDGAFNTCESLISATLPNGITRVGDFAFYGCINLSGIAIPDSVTIISDNAFDTCSSLENIVIPTSVTSIGNFAFLNCGSLTSITIPSGVISIGTGAFDSCSSLMSITVESENTIYSSLDGVLLDYSKSNLIQCPGGKIGSFIIPTSVTSIGEGAFYNCGSLTSITIPTGVTSLGDFVFYGCHSLTSVEIPIGVTSIGFGTFWGCSSLTSITIPTSVTSIGEYAFSECSNLTDIMLQTGLVSIGGNVFDNCNSLTHITIPDSLRNIGGGVFENCINLVSIEVSSGNTEYSSQDGVLYNKDISVLIRCPEGKAGVFVAPDNLNSIEFYAFKNCSKLTSITIPTSVTRIWEGTFYACSSLTNIAIPNTVTNIGEFAFYGCNSLTSITIPSSLTSIDAGCFYYCESLTSITIPSSVTSIGWQAFANCTSLTSVNIPNSVISLDESCFHSSGLTSIVIPSSVTNIGEVAFADCSSMTKAYFMGNAPTMTDNVFNNCANTFTVYYLDGSTGFTNPWYGYPTETFIPDNEFTVTFDSQGGSAVGATLADQDTTITAPTAPARVGYTFGGWYKEPSCTNAWVFATDKVTSNTTLYAKWTINQYTVAFNSQGGSSVGGVTTDYNTSIYAPVSPTRTGYTFAGWYEEPACTNAWNFATDKVTSATTLYAKWIPNTYTIAFNGNGATSSTMTNLTMTYDTAKGLTANTFTKTGYTFAGWATSPTGAVVYTNQVSVKNLTATSGATVTLYAKWIPNTYTIKFNINGGTSGAMSSLAMTYDTSKALTANAFKKTGYSFLGWATSSTGSVVYKDLASIKNLTTTKGATINLYAKWGASITSAASYNYNSIKVSWAYAGSATSYKIYRATSATGTYSLVKTAASTSSYWIDTSRVTGKTYYYKVYPVAGGKTYTHSTYKYAKAIPTTPSVSLTKVSTTSIKVTWTGVSGATKYQVYRATSATGTYSLVYTASTTLRSWTNTGLTAGKTYYYKVRAYHLEGTTKVYGSTSVVKYMKL